MKKEHKSNLRVILRLLLVALICLALFVGIGYLTSLFGLDQLSEEQIQEMIAACGAWAPIVFILVSFLQVTFIPVPFVVSILAGNLLFGFWGSFFYSLIGTVLGSVFAFVLGRRIGRPFVNWAFGDAEAVERYLSQAKGKEFVVFFFMFLLPFFPDDALCALAGITDLSNRQFAFILAISRPITVLGNLILWTGEVIPYNGWGILLMLLAIVVTVASFLLSMKYADKITEIFDRVTDSIAAALRRKKEVIIEHIHEKVAEHAEHAAEHSGEVQEISQEEYEQLQAIALFQDEPTSETPHLRIMEVLEASHSRPVDPSETPHPYPLEAPEAAEVSYTPSDERSDAVTEEEALPIAVLSVAASEVIHTDSLPNEET